MDQQELKQYYREGILALKSGSYSEALEAFRKCITIAPDRKKLFLNLGVAYARLARYNDAIEQYGEAIERDPQYKIAYFNRAKAYMEQERFEKAVQDYSQAIALDSKFAQAYFQRGRAYIELAMYKKAVKDFSTVIELNEANAKVYMYRGKAYGELGEVKRAFNDLNEAIERDPQEKKAYLNRSIGYRSIENFEKALKDVNRALNFDSNYGEGYYQRALIYSDQGQPRKALKNFSQAINYCPDSPMMYHDRALCHFRLGHGKKALNDLDTAIELEPDAKIYDTRGILAMELGRPSEAEKYLQKAITTDPNNPNLYFDLGLGYLKQDKHQKALNNFNKALAKEPSENILVKTYTNKGLTHFLANQPSKALQSLHKAIKQDPSHASAYLNRGNVYQQMKRFKKAAKDFKKAALLSTSIPPQESKRYGVNLEEKTPIRESKPSKDLPFQNIIEPLMMGFNLRKKTKNCTEVFYCGLALYTLTGKDDILTDLQKMQIKDTTLLQLLELAKKSHKDKKIQPQLKKLRNKVSKKDLLMLMDFLENQFPLPSQFQNGLD